MPLDVGGSWVARSGDIRSRDIARTAHVRLTVQDLMKLSAIVLSLSFLVVVGCNTTSDPALGLTSELRAQTGVPDDGVKPVARTGVPDDSVKPAPAPVRVAFPAPGRLPMPKR